MAGLPRTRACVCVGPLLSVSGPTCGSVFWRSPGAVKPHDASLERLLPSEVGGAPLMPHWMLGDPLFRLLAMMVLRIVKEPGTTELRETPPELWNGSTLFAVTVR